MSHEIYNIICPGIDLSNPQCVNLILRRMVEKYCLDNTSKDTFTIVDEFINFFEFNVEHNSVPEGTYEAFGHEEDEDDLAEWEHDALLTQEHIVQNLHFARGPYRKRNR